MKLRNGEIKADPLHGKVFYSIAPSIVGMKENSNLFSNKKLSRRRRRRREEHKIHIFLGIYFRI